MYTTSPIYFLGLITCASILYKVIAFALLHFHRSACSLDRYKHGSECWALITGSSNGIGYAYAQELVKRGFGVILLARNRTKLETAQTKLERECPGAMVKTVVVNAETSSASDLEQAMEPYKELNITVLINNVGGIPLSGHPYFKPIAAYTYPEMDAFTNINARFMTYITKLTLPILTRTGKPSLILNISSASEVGIAWLIFYSGAKGFVNAFSRALSRECKIEGLPVDVMLITPGDVQSNSQRLPVTLSVPSSRSFARDTLDKIDWAVKMGLLELRPHAVHDLALGLLGWLPESVKTIALDSEIKKKKAMYDGAVTEGKKRS